MLYIKYVAHY